MASGPRNSAKTAASGGAAEEASEEELPAGWRKVVHPGTGQEFFENEATKVRALECIGFVSAGRGGGGGGSGEKKKREEEGRRGKKKIEEEALRRRVQKEEEEEGGLPCSRHS